MDPNGHDNLIIQILAKQPMSWIVTRDGCNTVLPWPASQSNSRNCHQSQVVMFGPLHEEDRGWGNKCLRGRS